MGRKRWTPQTELDESQTSFREKRKWQIALRRYVLEKNKSFFYAPYFGLDNSKFREWVEVQFDEELNWENFSEKWQFDHIVPVAYFDFSLEEDLRLCWNFINIRVDKTTKDLKRETRIDVLIAKAYFEELFRQTGFSLCSSMVEKIRSIEAAQMGGIKAPADFINRNKEYIESVKPLSANDLSALTPAPLSKPCFTKRNS